MGISRKKESFIREYLIDADIDRAALRAGYSSRDGETVVRELLADKRTAAIVSEAARQRKERLEITTDSVILMTLWAYDAAMRSKQYGAAIKACELLSRHTGGFEKHEKAQPPDTSAQAQLIVYTIPSVDEWVAMTANLERQTIQ